MNILRATLDDARTIVNTAVQYCRQNGIHRIVLHASEAGKNVYEQMGFVSSPETMRRFT